MVLVLCLGEYRLKPEQANREAFVHFNLAKIDNAEGPDDVEYF